MTQYGHIATACVNQYRSRDIFAYLGLRYCLENTIARTDDWAKNNAYQAVFARKEGSYLRSYHFKQVDKDGGYEVRDLFVPSVAEALAEIALLRKCADHYNNSVSDRVFSYRLDDLDSSGGAFDPYMKGLRERQGQISAACKKYPDGKVVYIDITKFYPSITPKAAEEAWRDFCDNASLDEMDVDLGFKLIANHEARSKGQSILTGPMFSHFVANLVLKGVDRLAAELNVEYFRYVDDITVVGTSSHVDDAIAVIRAQLEQRGLKVHEMDSPKTLTLSTSDWLDSSNDFAPEYHSIAWMQLVGDIKKFLIFNSSKTEELEGALLVVGARLPIPDYSEAVKELSSYKKIRRLGLWSWLRFKTNPVTIATIVANAQSLATRLYDESVSALIKPADIGSYDRKRTVSRLRYRLGRLLLLGQEEKLEQLAPMLADWPELAFHREIIQAIVTEDCTNIALMGSNVCQAVAQIFRPSLKTAKFSRPIKGDKETQGLAVFILNGVTVEAGVVNRDHPILRFASGPVDLELLSSPRGLLQEIACLHGLGNVRHPSVLRSAFDIDENMIFDALEMDYGYSL